MVSELKAEQVRLSYAPASLKCSSTEELPPYEGIIGQERAISALNFGLNIQRPGFNIFVSGLAGTGKTTVIKTFLEALAKKKNVPADWCYVYNFKDSYCPKALQIQPGTGLTLQKDMKKLVDNIRRVLKQAFTSREYSGRRSEIVEVLSRKREKAFEDFSERAKGKGLLLKASQAGLILIPASGDQPMTDEDFGKMPPDKKEELAKRRDELTRELKDLIMELQVEEGKIEKQLEEFDHETAANAIGYIFEEMKSKYKETLRITDYLNDVQNDVVENYKQLIIEPKANDADPLAALQELSSKQTITKYEVNVLVDNTETKGAPVILELNPTFNNLFGRIEKDAQFGALYTDFTMIKSGSLHRANGGYLVMRIEDLLTSFQSWESLKRTLRDGNLTIEDIGERMGFMVTKSLRPEAIPLNVKIVLIGEPLFYYTLMQYDLEFNELFKVKADFDSVMERTESNLKDYAAVICRICTSENLRHLKNEALAKVLEHSSRLAGDQAKLSTLFADIADIIREANFWAGEDTAPLIEAKHITKAIDQKFYRSNLIQQHITEAINKGIYKIDTEN
ncbi:MAG: AAA family ATPase, partial [Dehalococcoidales bacterium]|nr:AAA family ATPase [Dehalococcoidales bacterium]